MSIPAWWPTPRALRDFPWRQTACTLRARFREDHLALTASSLTFTTLISLVPLFTVLLAVFSAFPAFGKLQLLLQQWLAERLFPPAISQQVLGALQQFAAKASRVGALGFAFFIGSALSLVLTIDRTLNAIWRVQRRRPYAHRVLMYWAVLTFGPLALAAVLGIASYAVSASRGWVQALPVALQWLLNLSGYGLSLLAVAALFRFVPNTAVRWRHAFAGAVFVGLGLEVARQLLSAYLAAMPAMSKVYGAFVTVPILLLWVYMVWIVVLLGAVVAAYLPSLLSGVRRRGGTAGWRFTLAVEVLDALRAARATDAKGLAVTDLARKLGVDALELEPVVDRLIALDWVGALEDGRCVLLADLAHARIEPLIDALLLTPGPSVEYFRKTVGMPAWNGQVLLPKKE